MAAGLLKMDQTGQMGLTVTPDISMCASYISILNVFAKRSRMQHCASSKDCKLKMAGLTLVSSGAAFPLMAGRRRLLQFQTVEVFGEMAVQLSCTEICCCVFVSHRHFLLAYIPFLLFLPAPHLTKHL